MKVLFFYRKPRENAFSIETVFDLIRRGLGNLVKAEEVFSHGNILRDIRRAKELKPDIFHITGHIHYLALFLPKRRTILTIHDVGHYEMTLRGLKKWLYGLIWFYLPLKKTRHITAISNFTKSRILAHFSVDPDRIKVIYNPVDPMYRPGPRSENNVPVILQIGSGHNKNVERLIKAVIGLPCKLLLINNLNENLRQMLAEGGISYEQRINLSGEELLSAYHQANVLYFASTYEGFGLPIIEAQACGIPVITSNIGSMAEISEQGKSACLVDPLSVAEIRRSIDRIINDQHYRSDLIREGLRNAARFEHKEIAREYFDFYQSVVQG